MPNGLILPSYAQGFALRDGLPANPGLHRGLVGLWAPFLGPTGLVLRDWSGYGNHGTLQNMEPATDWVATEKGYALDFGGSNEYVDCGAKSQYRPGTGAFSCSALVRLSSTNASLMIAATRNTGGFATGVPGWLFGVAANRSGALWIGMESANTNAKSYYATEQIDDGHWHSVAFTWQPQVLKLYIDGLEVTTSKSHDHVLDGISAATNLTIAARPNGAQYWTDEIALVSLHNRALAPNEVQQLHADPSAMLRPRRRITFAILAAAPHRVAVGQVSHTGTMAGQTFNTGQSVGQVHG